MIGEQGTTGARRRVHGAVRAHPGPRIVSTARRSARIRCFSSARVFRSSFVLAALAAVLGGPTAHAAELSVSDILMQPNQTVEVVISGDISSESTIGVNILVELIPRAGALGTVTFTAAPVVDVVQRGDPWPGVGTFSAFDTDSTLSSTLNGSVDDNGTFLSGPVTFSGPLTACPVVASADADGIWDVVLLTSVGDSNWQGLPTTLIAATITVIPGECLSDPDCNDGVVCTVDTYVSAFCVNAPDDSVCPDDGLFCNGTEFCDVVLDCASSKHQIHGAISAE